jgi:hypothetical protein
MMLPLAFLCLTLFLCTIILFHGMRPLRETDPAHDIPKISHAPLPRVHPSAVAGYSLSPVPCPLSPVPCPLSLTAARRTPA